MEGISWVIYLFEYHKCFGDVTPTRTHLFSEEQHDSLEHLVAGERCDGQVEEEPIEDGGRDVLQRLGQHQQRQADEDVRKDGRDARLAHVHHCLRDVARIDAVLVVGHGLDVERRVWQRAVHHRQAHRRQEDVEYGDDQQVPVVRCSLF